ncbi:MAG TPA: hypothetical protein PKI59_09880, partial [Candidatus Cloacimonadota bacterium]|nr:hypothetical protein [Candidatus Cloacimonadota bacterium]
MPASKNSTVTGKPRKSTNRYHGLRLYLVFSSLIIFIFFAVYTQFLIQKARHEQEYVPRIFAQYIAYTDGYLRAGEKYAQLLTEVSSKYLQFTAKRDFQQQLWDYISTEFMQENPIPIIITDASLQPLLWKNVPVSADTLYADLSPASQLRLGRIMKQMIQAPLVDDTVLTGFAFYGKPISFEQVIKNIDYSIISDNLEPKTKAFPYKNNTIAFIGEFDKEVSLITLSMDGDVRELFVLRPDRMKALKGPRGWPVAWEHRVGGDVRRISRDGDGF